MAKKDYLHIQVWLCGIMILANHTLTTNEAIGNFIDFDVMKHFWNKNDY